MADRVAWVVECGEDEEMYSRVQFAENELEACKLFEEATTFEAYPDECRRAPEFDEYAADGEVPVSAFLANGWWIGCTNCQHRVSEEGCDDCADELTDPDADECASAPEPVVDDKSGDVFCSEACKESWEEDKRRQKECVEALRAKATAKFPGCEILHVWGCYGKDESVDLKVPGCVNRVDWRPEDGSVFVAQMDLEAWRKYSDANKLTVKDDASKSEEAVG